MKYVGFKNYCLKVLLVFYSLHLQAGVCHDQIDLEEVWQRVLTSHPALKISDAEVQTKKGEQWQTSLYPNPILSIEAEDIWGSKEYEKWQSAEVTCLASQFIELGGKRKARGKLAHAQLRASQWEALSARNELRYLVFVNFLEAYIAQERVKLSRNRQVLARTLLNIVDMKVDIGKVSPLQRRKANLALQASQINAMEMTAQLDRAQTQLVSLWGCTVVDFERLIFNLEDYHPLPPFSQISACLFNSPGFNRSCMEMKAAIHNLQLQKAQRIPDVTINAGYRRYNDTDDHTFLVGIEIPLPIFDRNQGNIYRAKGEIALVEAKQEALLLDLKAQLELTYKEWGNAYYQAEFIKNDMLAEAHETFNLTQEGYQKGKLDYLELLDTQQTLFEIEEQYLDALTIYYLKKAEIERLIGTSCE